MKSNKPITAVTHFIVAAYLNLLRCENENTSKYAF